jgi:hypothetical protein
MCPPASPAPAQVQLWKRHPPPPDPTRYNLTAFAIQLNELTPGLAGRVAPTDCRLRPDQHALELGMYDQVCGAVPPGWQATRFCAAAAGLWFGLVTYPFLSAGKLRFP